MIEKVINAMTDKDYKTLASYFSEECKYFDYCPYLVGDSGFFIYGSRCLEMFFMTKLPTGVFKVAEPIIESENSANFFGSYNGPYLYARIKIEEYDESGLIKKVVVHPA